MTRRVPSRRGAADRAAACGARACRLALALYCALAAPAALADDEAPSDTRRHPAVAAADWDALTEIVVALGDHHYEPNEIELKVGRPYKLTLQNVGAAAHDMGGGSFFDENVIALRMVNSRSGRVMADHINSVYVRPRNTIELWLVPLVAGAYSFYCSLPGHRDGGMEGNVRIVRRAQPVYGFEPAARRARLISRTGRQLPPGPVKEHRDERHHDPSAARSGKWPIQGARRGECGEPRGRLSTGVP